MPREVAPEYLIKAAYLYQFLQYVTWPTDSFPSRDSPIVIGILGQDPFGEAIDRVVEGRRAMGRSIEVRRVTLEEAAAGCHVVFMAREERALLSHWLRRLRTKP
ncbi:MAG TPA: YfiR family protein, partial [Fibrobacteria bacterium]|nr:YfiR family protein [Fibrobacteria bacterium]